MGCLPTRWRRTHPSLSGRIILKWPRTNFQLKEFGKCEHLYDEELFHMSFLALTMISSQGHLLEVVVLFNILILKKEKQWNYFSFFVVRRMININTEVCYHVGSLMISSNIGTILLRRYCTRTTGTIRRQDLLNCVASTNLFVYVNLIRPYMYSQNTAVDAMASELGQVYAVAGIHAAQVPTLPRNYQKYVGG